VHVHNIMKINGCILSLFDIESDVDRAQKTNCKNFNVVGSYINSNT